MSVIGLDFCIRFGIQAIAVLFLLKYTFFRYSNDREALFSFTLFGHGVFIVAALMHNVEISMGFAFGLFAVFSMLSYRTESISVRNMTYLFLVITLSLIISVGPLSYLELVIISALICGLTWLCETHVLAARHEVLTITYEGVNNLKPDCRSDLVAELNELTGLEIKEVEVVDRNYKNDTAKLRVFFPKPLLNTQPSEQSDASPVHVDEATANTPVATKKAVSDKIPGVKVADLEASGLSVQAVSRLTSQWDNEYKQWSQRSLDKRKYVYIWADGIYSKVKKDGKLCLLVVMGVDTLGRKELLAVVEGERESEHSWMDVLKQLQAQGLTLAPKLAIGDGDLGLWAAMNKVWPSTQHQHCWAHKIETILKKSPKNIRSKMKVALQGIWTADTRSEAHKAFDLFIQNYEEQSPKVMASLVKDKAATLAFYDYPAEHWGYIRTSDPLESVFADIQSKTRETKNYRNRQTTLMMVFKLAQSAEKNWQRFRDSKLLADVTKGVNFKDGSRVDQGLA